MTTIAQGARFDITIFQGGSYARTFAFREADGTTRRSLAGYTGKAQVRSAPNGELFAEFDVDVSQVDDIEDEECGKVNISLVPDDSAGIQRTGSWDLALSNNSGDVHYVVQGRAVLDRRVTIIDEEDGS